MAKIKKEGLKRQLLMMRETNQQEINGTLQ
jgi:hypothetical protein